MHHKRKKGISFFKADTVQLAQIFSKWFLDFRLFPEAYAMCS